MASPIMIISGTNRPGANSLKVANLLLGFYQQAGVSAELFSLADLPAEAFEPTSYATKPAKMVAIQQRVLDAAGLHVVVPEYNGSFPGVMKYFIDLLKFPESFDKKPVAYVGVAAGTWGSLRSVEQLQQVFGYRNAYSFPNRVFIPTIHTKFDSNGTFSDAELSQRLKDQSAGFAGFVNALSKK